MPPKGLPPPGKVDAAIVLGEWVLQAVVAVAEVVVDAKLGGERRQSCERVQDLDWM